MNHYARALAQFSGNNRRKQAHGGGLKQGDPDWSQKCCVCSSVPTVFAMENDPAPLCGPCTFGEASTAGGNW